MRVEKVYKRAQEKREQRYKARCTLVDAFIAQTSDKAVTHLLEYVKKMLREKPGKYSLKHEEARAKRSKEVNDMTRVSAVNVGLAWTAEDERFILETTMTDKDAALKLGRTKASIVQRRSLLRRMKVSGG
jgi:hypothetical protein